MHRHTPSNLSLGMFPPFRSTGLHNHFPLLHVTSQSDFQLRVVKPIQSNHSGQSQRPQTIQWTNQNSKKIHVADINHGKLSARSL